MSTLSMWKKKWRQNIIIQKMSDRDEATEINDMYDRCLNNYLVDLNNVYANDFKLFNEVQIA